jgi:lambda family phage portal protein
MPPAPSLVHPSTGMPLQRIVGRRPAPHAALSGDAMSAFPYDASSWYSSETQGWQPTIYSPDYEINAHRDRMVGRSRDLVRNDGWASGGITRILDTTIGAHYRLSATPDYRALAFFNKAFDEKWATEFRTAAEALWRGWAEDPARYCDAARQLTFTQMMRLALRQRLIDGENLINLAWIPERVGYGAAGYATTLRLIDPDRLSNPQEQIDTMSMRGGVEIDADGVPVAYHIRRAHQNDWYGAAESMVWDRVERETVWGRQIIVHDYDRERVDQHRGIPVYVPVLNRLKMLIKADQVELQAAVLNAIFGVAVTSPYDPEGLREVATTSTASDDPQNWYWQTLKQDRQDNPLRFAEAQVLALRPGEKAEALQASRPGQQHEAFSDYGLRHIAAQLGTTAEQLTQNWSKMNYSSARSALLEASKTVMRRRGDFAAGTATPVYAAWLEEALDSGDLPLPNGVVPDFVEARAAYARCRWIGPGRGWIDPVKEAQAAVLRMDAGLSTLENECAEQGLDYMDVIPQRGHERKLFDQYDLPHPKWMGEKGDTTDASDAARKPQPE